MIHVQSLSRYYGSFAAVEDLSFSIDSNQVVGFLGLNGAGKSTTLKILAGLLEASTGSIEIDGQSISSATVSFRSKIGFLPEEPPLYRDMTVTEFLLYLGELRGCSASELRVHLPKVIDICQLNGRENQVINELSLGYRKRVGIAQAIIHQPSLVILDEPISGLDPAQIVEMRRVIRALASNATVLLSSHNLTEVEETCDRMLVLHDGRLIAEGTTESLSQQREGSQRLEICIHGSTDLLESTLKNNDSISIHSWNEDEDSVTAVLSSNTKPQDLVQMLVNAGVGVSKLLPASSELEHIFLSLTTKSGGQ